MSRFWTDSLSIPKEKGSRSVFPHLEQAIQAASKSGRQVTITGASELTPEGQRMFRLVSLPSGQTVVTDTPPALTPTTFTLRYLSLRLPGFDIDGNRLTSAGQSPNTESGVWRET